MEHLCENILNLGQWLRKRCVKKKFTEGPNHNILRKTIEGYLDSVPSPTFNTIKTLIIMHAFHSSRHLQSKWMLYFGHASMV